MTLKIKHGDWSFRAEALVAELRFRSEVVIEREASEIDEPGEGFSFRDRGDFNFVELAELGQSIASALPGTDKLIRLPCEYASTETLTFAQ